MTDMLIILGAMKSGTTSLFRYLADHPGISPCCSKEPNFFSDASLYRKGTRYYDGLWPADQAGVRYRMEASVNYTKGVPNSQIIKRLSTTGRRFKFIYIVRDPFERIESHYTHGMSDQWDIARSNELISDHAINTTMYFAHIQPYLEAFGLEKTLVIDFSRLKNSPTETLEGIYSFLEILVGAPDIQNCVRHNASDQKRRYSSALMLAMKVNYQLRISQALPKNLRRFIKNRFSQPVQRYTLNDTQKQCIAQKLAEDYANFCVNFSDQTNCNNWRIRNWLPGLQNSHEPTGYPMRKHP